ncbi:hypothetical protein MMC34_000202 [Xylographa carneopallida]|nr:hypothetical protein [Xylographa carneopallida]
MTTQYDKFGRLYNEMHSVPGQIMLPANTQAALGDISGFDILDLACGAGFYSNLLIDWGAAHVLGIDISTEMIREARSSLAPNRPHCIEYRVGDCTTPNLLKTLGIGDERQFDLVHGAWLLNYAADEEELTHMWRNVASNLKPGGRFVGIIPNLEADFSDEKPFDDPKYGVTTRAIGNVPHGYKVRVTAHSAGGVEFENYILNGDDVYERSAAAAGMSQVEWEAVSPRPEDIERMEEGFWDDFVARPFSAVCTAVREP